MIQTKESNEQLCRGRYFDVEQRKENNQEETLRVSLEVAENHEVKKLKGKWFCVLGVLYKNSICAILKGTIREIQWTSAGYVLMLYLCSNRVCHF